jgi:hypothetical protein
MPVHVQWDNPENTILRYDVEGHWTWEEFLEAFQKARIMAASTQHTIHAIVHPADNKSLGYLPSGTLSQVIQLYRNAPSNFGLTAIISDSDFFNIFNRISRQLYPRIADRYLFVASLEEARSLLLNRPGNN